MNAAYGLIQGGQVENDIKFKWIDILNALLDISSTAVSEGVLRIVLPAGDIPWPTWT